MNFKQFLKEGYYNETLHPRFWTGSTAPDAKMEGGVLTKLKEIAVDFAEGVEVLDYVEDIELTGSLANFNYTDYSDLDVHILLDFQRINDNVDLVKSALDGKRFIWNERHNIVIRGHEVELYFQDVNEPHAASGLYSILNDEWIHVPMYDKPEIDERDISKKKNQIEKDIVRFNKLVIKYKKNEKKSKYLHKLGDRFKEKIYKMRKDSLKNHGEFGIGNLVFKELRNSEAIKELIEGTTTAYDNIYSEKNTFSKYYRENW